MNRKHLLLFVCAMILVPLVVFVTSIVAGNFVPIGTFNTVEKQKLEQRQLAETPHSSDSPSNLGDTELVTEVNLAGTVKVNNFA
ncbi:MAG: hypothetical protein K2X93_14710 [Candidatus Obscuribacterales bacterium]|nr:hypothetical protein [Candidatus Obscuribacterales bacterium]